MKTFFCKLVPPVPIRLEAAHSKSDEPRVFPFGLAPTLRALFDEWWAMGNGLCVFHRGGQRLGAGAVRWAWKRATKTLRVLHPRRIR